MHDITVASLLFSPLDLHQFNANHWLKLKLPGLGKPEICRFELKAYRLRAGNETQGLDCR